VGCGGSSIEGLRGEIIAGRVKSRPPNLAARGPVRILKRNSGAMNPEAACRAVRPCLEGSQSRDRL